MTYFDAPYRPADLTLNSDAINNSCVGFWPLTDGVGNTGKDISTNADDATGTSVQWETSVAGTRYDAAGGYVVSSQFPVTNVNAFSISVWIKNDNANTDYLGLWSYFAGPNASSKAVFWRNNNVECFVRNASNTTEDSLGAGVNLNSKANENESGMAHCVFTINSGTATWYVNGIQTAQDTSFMAGPYIPASQTDGFVIGHAHSGEMTTGAIQNVRFWEREISAAEALTLYTRPWTGTNYDTEALWLSPPASPTLSTASQATSLMANCVGWWPLTEGSGTTATDLVGSNDGTQSGGVSWASSEIGTVASFDGSNDQFDISHNSSYNAGTTGELTVTAWAKFDTFGTYRNVVSKDFGFNHGAREWVIYGEPSGNRVSAQLFDSSGTAYGVGTGVNTTYTGVWYFLSMVWDGTDLKLFVDGSVASTASAAITPRTSTEDVQIGYNGRFRHDGDVQNVRIFSSALTADQIRLLYERPWIGAEYNESFYLYPPVPSSLTPLDSSSINTDLQGWWPLTETDDFASGAADISGNSNTLSASGTVTSKFESVGTSAFFGGSSNLAKSNPAISLNTGFTAAAWAKFDNAASVESQIVGAEGGSGTVRNFQLKRQPGGQVQFAVFDSTGSTAFVIVGTELLEPDIWYHVVGTYDSTSGSVVYLNGVEEVTDSRTHSTMFTLDDSTDILNVGWTGRGTKHVGDVQNVRVWSRALSATEVADIYYSPWLGSAYTGTSSDPATNRYFSPAAFARLG